MSNTTAETRKQAGEPERASLVLNIDDLDEVSGGRSLDVNALSAVSEGGGFPNRDPLRDGRAAAPGDERVQQRDVAGKAGTAEISADSSGPSGAMTAKRRSSPRKGASQRSSALSEGLESNSMLNMGPAPDSLHEAIEEAARVHRTTKRGFVYLALKHALKAENLGTMLPDETWDELTSDSRRSIRRRR